MLAEAVAGLGVVSGGRYVDGTLGGGGHAQAVLERSGPGGFLFGIDRDDAALAAAGRRLLPYAGRFRLERGSYGQMGEWLEAGAWDGVLLDLGVSSPQLDEASRGFSFRADGPLDMRMDRRQTLTAADWLAEVSEAELSRVLWELGDEREARRLARAIVEERRRVRFVTTRQLAGLIERWVAVRGDRVHPATRVFQALRMVVNDELGELRRGLEAGLGVLRSGGRLVVIAFHSGEDRLVKEFGRVGARDYEVPGGVDVPELRRPREPQLRLVERKALVASADEMRRNVRARSARMRVFEKI